MSGLHLVLEPLVVAFMADPAGMRDGDLLLAHEMLSDSLRAWYQVQGGGSDAGTLCLVGQGAITLGFNRDGYPARTPIFRATYQRVDVASSKAGTILVLTEEGDHRARVAITTTLPYVYVPVGFLDMSVFKLPSGGL